MSIVCDVTLCVTECVQLFKLSPVAGEKDYFYHLDEREGLTDLYDLHS